MKKNITWHILGITFILSIMFLVLAVQVDASFTDTDVISWLDFQEGSGTTLNDQSTSNIDATLYGSGSWSNVGGPSNLPKSYYFDGSTSKANYSRLSLTRGDNTVTYSYWINMPSIASTGADSYVVYAEWNGAFDLARGVQIGRTVQNGKLVWDIYPPSSGALSSTIKINQTYWQHVTVVVNGSTVKGYLNGTEVFSGPLETYSGGTVTQSAIGVYFTYYFLGNISQAIVINKSLNAVEIQELYNGGAGKTYAQYFNMTPSTYFSISAKDYYDNQSLSQFSVSVNGSNYNQTFYTTNSSLVVYPLADMSGDNTSVNATAFTGTYYYYYNQTPFGRIGYGAQFEKNDIYVMGNGADTTGNHAISLWINPKNATSSYPVVWSSAPTVTNMLGLFNASASGTAYTPYYYASAWVQVGKSYNLNEWRHILFQKQNGRFEVFIDGTLTYNGSNAFNLPDYFTFGRRNDTGYATQYMFNGTLDEIYVYKRALTNAEVQTLYTLGTVSDKTNLSLYLPFENITSTSNTTYNLTTASEGYYPSTYINYNVSSAINSLLYRTKLGTIYLTNNISLSGYNYVRDVNYAVNVSNCTGINQVNILIDGTYVNQTNISCADVGATYTASGVFRNTVEGLFKFSLYINGTDYARDYTTNLSLVQDLYAPQVSILYSATEGFTASPTINMSLTCVDSIFPIIYYNLTYDDSLIYGANKTANTTQINNSLALTTGSHLIRGTCSDYWQGNSTSVSFSKYVATLLLWDEIYNQAFNMNYASGGRLWQQDNGTYYDFKLANVSNISVSFSNASKYRIDLNYTGNINVFRYIDLEFLTENTIKVCADREGQSYTQQLIYSSTVTPVFLKNSYVGCYIIADETRFAYADAYSIVGFTIASDYYLYEYEDGATVYLASIDGTTNVIINLDNLKFTSQGVNIDFKDEALTFTRSDIIDNATLISYRNVQADNLGAYLEVYKNSDNTLLLNITNITTPNNWQVLFYWGGYPAINESTLFRSELHITKTSGKKEVTTTYFDGLSRSGVLNTALGIMLSVGLIIGGLSLVVTSYAFGWFGILITICAIIINALTIPNDITFMLYGIYGIVLLFQVIIAFSGSNERVR